MEEEWRTIEDFPYYEVSNMGNIRSKERDIVDSWGRHYHLPSKMMTIQIQIGKKDHYPQAMTTIADVNRKHHRLIVARLVAKAFIPNPDNLPQVNHKDENSLNNCVSNLEWCTSHYNNHYKDKIKRGGLNRRKLIDIYDSAMNFIETIKGAVEIEKKYNISRQSICDCCKGRHIFAKGYHFEYHPE